MKRENLCLLVHCIRTAADETPKFHPELFIDHEELEKLIVELAARGYRFKLPGEAAAGDAPVCSFTFDDGYFNNMRFLDLAEKYRVPFILFLVSYNVTSQLAFIWDVWSSARRETWPLTRVDYLRLYREMEPQARALAKSDLYRPFTVAELDRLAGSPWAFFALHGHSHQPLVGRFRDRFEEEIRLNAGFLSRFQRSLMEDFSFPCGLYDPDLKKLALQRFTRVYSINGGGFEAGDRLISRISLISPAIGGALIEQIDRSFSPLSRMRRHLTTFRYSNYYLTRV